MYIIQENPSLEHHGVLGMHWGHHKSSSDLRAEADVRDQRSSLHAHQAADYQRQHADLMKKGLQSEAFKRVYGEDAYKQSEWQFQAKNGQTRAMALQETANNLRRASNMHVRAANHESGKAVKLRAQADKQDANPAKHSDSDVEAFLEHHGVLGMHWGHHKLQVSGSSAASTRTVKGADFVDRHKTAIAVGGAAATLLARRKGYKYVPIALGTAGALALSHHIAKKHAENGRAIMAKAGMKP